MSGSIFFNQWKRVRMLEAEKRQQSYFKCQRSLLQATRYLAHIFVGFLVLATGLLSKWSLLYLTNQLGYFEKNNAYVREAWCWILVLAICAQYAIEFILSIFSVLFRQQMAPSFFQMFVVSTEWHFWFCKIFRFKYF